MAMTTERKIRAIWLYLSFEAVEDPKGLLYCYKIIDRCQGLINFNKANLIYEFGITGQFLLQELERLIDEKKLQRLMELKREKEHYDEWSRYGWFDFTK